MNRIIIYITIFMLAFVPGIHAEETISGPIKAKVLKVYDGDTIRVKVKLWLDQEKETKVRILGIDTPEMDGKCSLEKKKAQQAKNEITKLINKQKVTLTNIRYGKYSGRVLADVETADGVDIKEQMLKLGLAAPYYGSTRTDWCKK
jgi:micrococcal nuclease